MKHKIKALLIQHNMQNSQLANDILDLFEHRPENEPWCSMGSHPASPELCKEIDNALGINRTPIKIVQTS